MPPTGSPLHPVVERAVERYDSRVRAVTLVAESSNHGFYIDTDGSQEVVAASWADPRRDGVVRTSLVTALSR